MIIYGTRMVGRRNPSRRYGTCEHCGKRGRLDSYTGRQFFTLYFIPLIPMGAVSRVVDECASCHVGNRLRESAITDLIEGQKSAMQACLAAATKGEHEFQDPEEGERVPTGPYLVGAVGVMLSLGLQEDARELMTLLKQQGAIYEHALLRAEMAFRQGRTEQALKEIEIAQEQVPDALFPSHHAATTLNDLGRFEKALEYLEALADRHPTDVSVLVATMDAYEGLNRLPEAAQCCDRLLALAPELARDKAFMKAAKKLFKKARYQPDSLAS